MKRWAYMAVVLLCIAGVSHADEFKTLFHQGNQFYDQGNYAAAVNAYEKIVSSGKANWQVFYNLGNSYFRLHQLGKAILSYEKALKLNPDNEDIRFNLEYANLQVVDRIPEPPRQPLVAWIERQFYAPPFTLLLYLTLGLYALGMFLLGAKYFWPRVQHLRFYRGSVWITLILFAMVSTLFLIRWYKEGTEKYAIVLKPEISVTSSPTRDAKEVFSLHEGTKLQIQELSGDWARIRLRDGKIGWIQREAIGRI